jgi:hypothetical protein
MLKLKANNMRITSYIKILTLPAIMLLFSGCDMPIYAPAIIDLNQKGTETEGEQIYNAEDQSANWFIFDWWPEGAAIKNEEENGNRIIHLEGTGLKNGFALRKADGSYLNNIDATKIRWKAKFDHDFLIYVALELDDGNITHLSYRARNYSNHPSVLPFVLPETAESGLWETTTRDLSKDLHKYLPKRSIASVLDFEVRGSGLIDNIVLVVDDDNVTDPGDGDDHNNTDPDNDTNNTIPVADSGADQLVTTGTLIALDGSGSYDADNDPLTYKWAMTEKPSDSTAVLSDDTTVDPTFTTDKEGSYIIKLIVNDGTIDSNASTVAVMYAPCIHHDRLEYCPVLSPDTAKIWLDRNLGAAEVCSIPVDTACSGDYYQWGRETDGHQIFNSDTNITQASDVNKTGDQFIIGHDDWVSTDRDGSIRSANWSKTDGSSICPVGYSVPTLAELTDENTDVANGFLRLPFSGFRDINGTVKHLYPNMGHLWSSDASLIPDLSKSLIYDDNSTYENVQLKRATGLPIRCIKK